MINPPMTPDAGGYSGVSQPVQYVNVDVAPEEQLQIVKLCNAWKHSVRNNAKPKKQIMRECYAYSRGKFVGNDLLPEPSTRGSQRKNKSNRPQIFLPKIREIVKTLHSFIMLTILPSDDNYLRIRGKDEVSALYEDELTEGFLEICKKSMITEKVSEFILDLVQTGSAAAQPTSRDSLYWEWAYDGVNNSYVPKQIDTPPLLDLVRFDPLHYYVDPFCEDPEYTKWAYFGQKKIQELKDNSLYFNTDELDKFGAKTVHKPEREEVSINGLNDLNDAFVDNEPSVKYDLYYFPYLKTETREYRNMLIGVAAEQVLIRFHPNIFPKGMNPVVFQTWAKDTESPYGIGPIEDVKDIQKNINIMINYLIKWMSTNGTRWVIGENVDLTQAFGESANILRAKNPQTDFKEISGNFSEPANLMNLIGTLTADMQIVSGAQNPFQGSSNIDFKKTATEMQIIQENSLTANRLVVEHISIGVKRIFERLMYIVADLYKDPIPVRVDDPVSGTRYINVDFRLLKTGMYEVELTNINASQSKQAQVESLMQLLELIGNDPTALIIGEPIIQEIGKLQGLKKTDMYIQQIKERMGMMNAAQPPITGVPGPQNGSGLAPQPSMGEPPPAVA